MNLLSTVIRWPVVSTFVKQSYQKKGSATELAGLSFPNKVGLAAGFDKDAKWLHALQYLGFGHVEVGTVTPRPQSGNPKPRLFRLKKDRALINRMGFNNAGVDAMVEQLKKRPKGLIVGGNIGKNKDTPNEHATRDYEICFEKLYPWVDYFTINVSSPNTPGLRELQGKEALRGIIEALQVIRLSFMKNKADRKAIFLKIAPDLNESQLEDIAQLCEETDLDGLILTNTTISREGLHCSENTLNEIGAGGLSGAPLKDSSNRILSLMRRLVGPDFPIIGVGGIMNPEDAAQKIKHGAQIVQVYTGFIYYGPKLAGDISLHL